MSLILALDSSRRRGGSIALVAGEKLVALVEHDPAKGYAEAFFELADRALMMAGRTRDEITQLAVVTGPGSYTGLRIGVMTAKSLAHASGLPLYGATSLDLLAGQALLGTDGSIPAKTPASDPLAEPLQILALMEAGRDALYAATYRARGRELELVRGAWRTLAPALARELRDGPRLSLVSADGPETLELVRAQAPTFLDEAEVLACVPMARTLALSVAGKCPWCVRADPAALLPVYLGPSQAERAAGIGVEQPRQSPSDGENPR